jgi:hypothetical protein
VRALKDNQSLGDFEGAVVQKVSRNSFDLCATSNDFISVMHHMILRCDSSREENLDALERCVR